MLNPLNLTICIKVIGYFCFNLIIIQERYMKSLGIIFSIFLSFSAFSQLDNYIVNEEGLWSTLELHCLPTGNNYTTYFIKLEGDTIIDGFTYKEI